MPAGRQLAAQINRLTGDASKVHQWMEAQLVLLHAAGTSAAAAGDRATLSAIISRMRDLNQLRRLLSGRLELAKVDVHHRVAELAGEIERMLAEPAAPVIPSKPRGSI